MANSDIIQNLIFQLGQNQRDRLPPELDVHFADIDERSPEDLLAFAQEFAEFVNYYRRTTEEPVTDWQNFFPAGLDWQQLNQSDDVSPHLALFLTFLELYQQPRTVINEIPGRHLNFYYRDVLRLQPKAAVPDVAHVLFELKKRADKTLITPQTLLSAGKDATGVELIYAPLRDTVINSAQVAEVRSLFLDRPENNPDRGTVRYAPIANSANGVGEALPKTAPQWSGFGHNQLPTAEVGFALAAPVLRMQEGQRRVTVELTLSNRGQLTSQKLQNALDVFITGEKAWLGPYRVSPTLTNGQLKFSLTLSPEDPPVVDYSSKVHGYTYSAQAPIVQVVLNADAANYLDFRGAVLDRAQVKVAVSQISSLTVENDSGALSPAKAFLPFGFEPKQGAKLLVGYAEAFSKKLSKLTLDIEWAELPGGFKQHYANYGLSNIDNNSFTANVSFQDAGSWQVAGQRESLFNSNNAARRTFSFTANRAADSTSIVTQAKQIYALNKTKSAWAKAAVDQTLLVRPMFVAAKLFTAEPRPGFIIFSLNRDFLHTTYRRKSTEDMLDYSNKIIKAAITKENPPAPPEDPPVLLNEPYTPKIQSISLGYDAYSEAVPVSTNSLTAFANPDLQFFHLTYFGQRREHRYQRQQLGFQINPTVSLLPRYPHAGELLIGLSDLQPQDSVSILFQVAEGSANPDRAPEDLSWFALCDNYWKPLTTAEVVLDTTNQLRTSGIIQFVIPPEATRENTILPRDRIWIKAVIANHVDAVCQLITVAANAVAVQFLDQGNDPNHLLTPLLPGSLAKIKGGLTSVKAVSQPFASFGNRPTETDSAFHTRIAERLRHKQRAITAWDYERLILNAFSHVHQVKVIPHASENSWLAPGHVLIVVVPDLTHQIAINPLQPKVDLNTISQITDYLQQRTGMQVQLKVKNPRYQTVQADFKVQFHRGYEFNYYSTVLNQALIQFLSPWLEGNQAELGFSGKIYKSVLLDFIEELGYVDYVTDFKLYSYSSDNPSFLDLNQVDPDTPDTILVSASAHTIAPIA